MSFFPHSPQIDQSGGGGTCASCRQKEGALEEAFTGTARHKGHHGRAGLRGLAGTPEGWEARSAPKALWSAPRLLFTAGGSPSPWRQAEGPGRKSGPHSRPELPAAV